MHSCIFLPCLKDHTINIHENWWVKFLVHPGTPKLLVYGCFVPSCHTGFFNMAKMQRSIAKPVKVLNHLCAVGEVEKMYIPPVMEPCHDFSGLGGFNPSQKNLQSIGNLIQVNLEETYSLHEIGWSMETHRLIGMGITITLW